MGGKVYKKRSSRNDRPNPQRKSRMTCVICDADCKDLRGLRNHFVTCVDRNGNPNGARWDDALENAAASAGSVVTQSRYEGSRAGFLGCQDSFGNRQCVSRT